MKTDDSIRALRMVAEALDEVKRSGGVMPSSDDPEDTNQPMTFLDLVKQFAGGRTPESALIAVIDAVAPLCPDLAVQWK